MEARDLRLSEIAAAQHGAFTVAQAVGCGLSRTITDRRVQRGLLVRLHPNVYGLAGAPTSWQREIMAAVLSVESLAAASHQTAAELWGMTSRRGRSIEVVTSRWDRVSRPLVTVHESKDLVTADVAMVEGIPIMTPARTVVDMGANTPGWLVEACLDAGLRKGLFTVGDVDRFVARLARKGRRGVGVIRPILEERCRWDGATESELEDLFRQVVGRGGLRLPTPQFVLRDEAGDFVCRADFAYPERQVLIELDSEAFHMDRRVFRADRRKQNRALALGWRTLRFTWHDLIDQPATVIGVLADI